MSQLQQMSPDVNQDINISKIGKKITYLRKSRGYTQAKLAELINVSIKTISNWELGEKRLTLTHLLKLANLFDVSTDEILCRKAEVSVLSSY